MVAAFASASRCRSAASGGVVRGQGIGTSSHVVAAYTAELSTRGGGGSASISIARRRSRSIGAASPRSAASTAPGKAARSVGSKSPARSTEKRSTRVSRPVLCRPRASTTLPRMEPPRAPIRWTSRLRSPTGSSVHPHRRPHRERSTRGTAAVLSR